MIRNIVALARITFLEGLRSRIFYGLFLVALISFSSTSLLSSLFIHDVIKVAVDLALGTASVIGLILTLFLATQLLAKDLEKRTIQMVLARAVSRPEYILGKFSGVALIITASMFLLGAFASLAVWGIDQLTEDRYGIVHWPLFLLSLSSMTLMLILLASVIFFFSSFSSSTFLALGLTFLVYIIGQSVEELRNFLSSGSEGIEISAFFTNVAGAVYYLFPNLAAFNFKTQAAHGLSVDFSVVLWSGLYGVFYTAIMITASAWIFRRRELP